MCSSPQSTSFEGSPKDSSFFHGLIAIIAFVYESPLYYWVHYKCSNYYYYYCYINRFESQNILKCVVSCNFVVFSVVDVTAMVNAQV